MGRGLSELQKTILRLAWIAGGMLRVPGILKAVWGWQEKVGIEDHNCGGQIFNRAGIGPQEYNRAHATLSRTLERLRLRGLIEVFKNVTGYSTGIVLTDMGAKLALDIGREGVRPPRVP